MDANSDVFIDTIVVLLAKWKNFHYNICYFAGGVISI